MRMGGAVIPKSLDTVSESLWLECPDSADSQNLACEADSIVDT